MTTLTADGVTINLQTGSQLTLNMPAGATVNLTLLQGLTKGYLDAAISEALAPYDLRINTMNQAVDNAVKEAGETKAAWDALKPVLVAAASAMTAAAALFPQMREALDAAIAAANAAGVDTTALEAWATTLDTPQADMATQMQVVQDAIAGLSGAQAAATANG